MIGGSNEAYEWIKAGTAGWRFLFSRRYRARILSEWGRENWYHVTFDIVCGVAGITATSVVLTGIGLLLADLLSG